MALWSASLFAQAATIEFDFFKQPQSVGALTVYVASVCNRTPIQKDVFALDMWSAAWAQGIQPANNVSVLVEANRAKKMSWQRKVLLGLEIASYGVTIATASDAIKIDTSKGVGKLMVAAAPTVGLLIRTATTAVSKDFDETYPAMKFNLAPSLFRVPANSCVEYDLLGSSE